MNIGTPLLVVPVALHALLEPHAVRLLPAHLVDETRRRLLIRAVTRMFPPRPAALGPRVRVPAPVYSLLLQLLAMCISYKGYRGRAVICHVH